MKIIKTILLCALLSACATKTVYVAAQCPVPQLPHRPHYPVADLKPGDAPSVVIKGYVKSLGICERDRSICTTKCEALK